MSIDLSQLHALAAKYRAKRGHETGVVLFWRSLAYGWKNTLRDPQHERPGALAVDADGRVFQAIDGNDYDGAQRWREVAA